SRGIGDHLYPVNAGGRKALQGRSLIPAQERGWFAIDEYRRIRPSPKANIAFYIDGKGRDILQNVGSTSSGRGNVLIHLEYLLIYVHDKHGPLCRDLHFI